MGSPTAINDHEQMVSIHDDVLVESTQDETDTESHNVSIANESAHESRPGNRLSRARTWPFDLFVDSVIRVN